MKFKREIVGEVSINNLCDHALKHYEEVSDKADDWYAFIPHAIEFYRENYNSWTIKFFRIALGVCMIAITLLLSWCYFSFHTNLVNKSNHIESLEASLDFACKVNNIVLNVRDDLAFIYAIRELSKGIVYNMDELITDNPYLVDTLIKVLEDIKQSTGPYYADSSATDADSFAIDSSFYGYEKRHLKDSHQVCNLIYMVKNMKRRTIEECLSKGKRE